MYFKLILRETTDPLLSNNGGDYTEYVIVNEDCTQGAFFSSFEGEMCPGCGMYIPAVVHCDHYTGPVPGTNDPYPGPISWQIVQNKETPPLLLI